MKKKNFLVLAASSLFALTLALSCDSGGGGGSSSSGGGE